MISTSFRNCHKTARRLYQAGKLVSVDKWEFRDIAHSVEVTLYTNKVKQVVIVRKHLVEVRAEDLKAGMRETVWAFLGFFLPWR